MSQVAGQTQNSIRVLLVDESTSEDGLAATLERTDASLDVTTAVTPPERDQRVRFDCVVVVNDPPERDGLSVLETIRTSGTDLPVIFLDREDDPATAQEALDDGAAEFVHGERASATPGVLTNRIRTTVDAADAPSYEAERNMLDALFEHVPVYLYVKDRDARHVRVSNEFDDPEEFIGKTDLDTYPDEPADDFYADDMDVIRNGEHVINREEYIPDEERYQLASKVPWRNADGEIQGLIGVTREITARKRYQQQLERQNERLGQLASVLSHDVRNPLQVATGKIELAKADCDSPHLDDVRAALDRMDELLDDLLALVQHGRWVAETDAVSVREAATASWNTVTHDTGTLSIADDVVIEANEARFRQLLDNLFRNAVVHAGADVTVTIGALTDGSGFYVEDDGTGIDPDEYDKLFEFGYTTHEDGSGLGLAIVKAITDAHGWDVSIGESEAGGARFEFAGIERPD